MKQLLPFALLLTLAACSGGAADTSAEKAATAGTTTAPCPELSEPQFAAAGQQARRYYTAPGFNPKSKECWAMLRAAAKQSAKSTSDATVIAFIDAPKFTPGDDGAYGKDDKVRQQVIAQVLVNNDAGLYEFTPDPFGYGKYVE